MKRFHGSTRLTRTILAVTLAAATVDRADTTYGLG